MQNEEADALTNADYRHFSPDKRIPVDIDRLGFRLLPMLFEEGEKYVQELEASRKAAKEKEEADKRRGLAKREGKKRKLGSESLREKDPW